MFLPPPLSSRPPFSFCCCVNHLCHLPLLIITNASQTRSFTFHWLVSVKLNQSVRANSLNERFLRAALKDDVTSS